ncbi:MAG: beta-glucosidase [Parcubacteria group bacterium Athens1014_10]|nr:MAG: beta-glucosidase [Parcubacteria group bacterium Athens1014_10]TSD04997.1 MAG: beta-glucosidase [Parcubacteria group bacterium Athens0714_12]
MPKKNIIKKMSRREKLKYYETLEFPKGFLWGAATSSHQVEGDNKNNDWWVWENDKKYKRFHSGKAANQHELYENDIKLIKELNQNSHRFSIEWSRIEPKEGVWDFSEIKYYKNELEIMKKSGLKTMVTLHHFTNPVWFAQKGGFAKRKSIFYFQRYVNFIVEQLGNLVDFWITINEPGVYVSQSYLNGVWPPQIKNKWQALKVYLNLARGHKKAYKSIHKIYKTKKWGEAKVGIAQNTISSHSYHPYSFGPFIVITFINWLWNHSFFWLTKGKHDFLGINYYFHFRINSSVLKTFDFFINTYIEHREMSSVGWEVYPEGIFNVLLDMKKYKLPIYITENGIATVDENKRSRYLVAYLKEIYHAICADVPVKGYFYWALIDNFEWEKGFEPRFGLIEVNYKTFERNIRSTARVYSRICQENSIKPYLLKFLGHGISPKDIKGGLK